MGCISILIGAGLNAVSGLEGAKIGAGAAKSAAETQADAAKAAADATLQMFNKTQANLQPYIQAGYSAIGQLQALTGTAPAGAAPVKGLGAAPFGFQAPQGQAAQGQVQWVNRTSGQTWTAPSGGYIPPSADWAPSASGSAPTWQVGPSTPVANTNLTAHQIWNALFPAAGGVVTPTVTASAPPPPSLPTGITMPAGGWPTRGSNGLFPGQKSLGDGPSSGNNFFGFGSLDAALAAGAYGGDKPEYANYAASHAAGIAQIKAAMANPVVAAAATAPVGQETMTPIPTMGIWGTPQAQVPQPAAGVAPTGAAPTAAPTTTPAADASTIFQRNGVPVDAQGNELNSVAYNAAFGRGKHPDAVAALPEFGATPAPSPTPPAGNAITGGGGAGPTVAAANSNPNPVAMAFAQDFARRLGYVGAGDADTSVRGAGGTTTAGTPLNALNAPLTAPFRAMPDFNPTMDQLEKTPGYQFIKDQGLKATQNSFAAKGLGSSGAAMKGAAQFATDLAGTTYQQQFDNYLHQYQQQYSDYLNQNQQIYSMLSGQVAAGQNAATQNATNALTSQGNVSDLLTSAAAAQAGGTVGGASALMGGLANAGNSASNAAVLMAMQKGGMFERPKASPAANALTQQ